MIKTRALASCALLAMATVCARAQPPANGAADPKKAAIPEAVSRGAEVVLALEEKGAPGEWPYEGVYRVDGQIPVGYRVGGTGISAMALMSAPGFEHNDAAKSAVQRALAFTLKGLEHPLMSPTEYDAGYDVRGWGYTYGLAFMLKLKENGLVPEADKERVEKAIRWCIEALAKTEIPQVGGWNYARPPGKEKVAPPSPFMLKVKEKGLVAEGDKERVEKAIRWCIEALAKTEIPQVGGWNYARPPGKEKVAPPSPFMTAPTLQALFEAKKAGYEVDAAVVGRALDYLESAREPSGGIVYSGKGAGGKLGVPGAVGRMLATESTLYLAGRGSQANVRAAVDAYIVHWDWLNQRRAKPGTHMGPYQIAPYYFYYAHYYAAFAVELLPEQERGEYRRRINDLLMATRHEDGSWNDRVFPRSANFGTSMAVMAMLMPQAGRPAGWGK